jgi:hypothetical protein
MDFCQFEKLLGLLNCDDIDSRKKYKPKKSTTKVEYSSLGSSVDQS